MSRAESTENRPDLDRVTLTEFLREVLSHADGVPERLGEHLLELTEKADSGRAGKIRKLIEEASGE